jgi:hypothetical protein
VFNFSLDAQVCGTERSVRAETDGLGIIVHTSDGLRRAGSWNEAIRIARDYIGEFLRPAQRPGVPWGLRVSVPDGQAVYGDWPLLSGPSGGGSFRQTPLSQIRGRWSGSSAHSALENAIQIIRAYAPRGRAAA